MTSATDSFRPTIAAYVDAAPGWVVGPAHAGYGGEDGDEPWIEVAHPALPVPSQGWKLHVSATARSAPAVLARALPVLVAHGATFKVAASLLQLERLNQGLGGASQVGKFLTVYPSDDGRAIRLAEDLDQATRGLAGPRIPSDRQLKPGSLVHYRYGGFDGRWLQTTLGEIVPAFVGPDGALVTDARQPMYRQPEWLTDPFLDAGIAVRPPPIDLVVAERYLTVAVLNNSARTAVRLAIDIETGERLILKHARDPAAIDGDDASFVRLRREAEFLMRFAGNPHFPGLRGLVESGSDLFLLTEHCDGPTLEQRVDDMATRGRLPTIAEVMAWGRELAGVLDEIHQAGFVYGDVKPSNVIVAADAPLRLVDFETVTSRVDRSRDAGIPDAIPVEAISDDDGVIGTLGFVSPQRVEGLPLAPADDIYAVGALLAYLLSAANPSDAPDPFALLDRPLRLLNPEVPVELDALVARCLARDASARPSSMVEVELALGAVTAAPPPGGLCGGPAPDWARPAAERLVADLSRRVGGGFAPQPGEPRRRDVHDGEAGMVLVFAEAAGRVGGEVAEALTTAARSLVASLPLEGGPLPGLYVGEAGIGAALLRAGVVLGDDALIAAAVEKGRAVAGLPYASPDLYHGTAGRLRAHLALWDVTGDPAHLSAALAAGEHLLASAERPPDGAGGGLQWPIPEGYGPASGIAYLGYAHGSAGIADSLVDLFEATGDERLADAARSVATGVATRAAPALRDGTGRDWAVSDDGGRSGPFWCHGATGVGRFLLHAGLVLDLPDVTELALAATRSAASGARWAGPGQCHGLAGNAEYLLDVYEATGDESWLGEAFVLLRLMRPYVEALDDPRRMTDGFLGGRAGIAACLLRFSEAGRGPRPHLMDRRALGRRSLASP